MQKTIQLRVSPAEAVDSAALKHAAAVAIGLSASRISAVDIQKRSIDARGRQPKIQLTVNVGIDEPLQPGQISRIEFNMLKSDSPRVIIIGAGPAGLFAALQLLEKGIRPIVVERGKDVKSRRRDLAKLNREGIVNEDSNYCFGEGGAGTYSDGKLYTRSTKRGDVAKILKLLVQFGAPVEILIDAHPHIGTNKLPGIIEAMRKQIIDSGGEVHFDQRVTEMYIRNGKIEGVGTSVNEKFHGDAVILATGHSARDIFQLLADKGIAIEAKPFALGVRAEHPQELIDQLQYHCQVRNPYLPPAAYSLVTQVQKKGVFSFCMCPGGIIAPAATAPGEVVVNGWSPSKRNNPYANSGIVVSVDDQDLDLPEDFERIMQRPKSVLATPLRMMYWQSYVERTCFLAGGGNLKAPAQRLVDFTRGKRSSSLPDCSYHPGIVSSNLMQVLPAAVGTALRDGFISFGEKMKGYLSNEAVIVATESRTSSPVRIPRSSETLEHIEIGGLYPCGEGAGYAGGIVSAAMDGQNVALAIAVKLIRR